MTLTRRRFLTSTATLTAAVAVGVAVDPQAAQASTARLPLRRSTFTPLLGRFMTVTHAGRRTRVRLRQIRDVVGAPAGSDASFILQFSARHPLPDGLHTLSHPDAGSHLVFMSGVYALPQRRYEVVVNRSLPPAGGR